MNTEGDIVCSEVKPIIHPCS